MRAALGFAALALPSVLLACGAPAAPPPQPPPPPPAAAPVPKEPADPLGPRPESSAPEAWVPPSPTVFAGPGGMSVWLLERHDVPLVSCDLAVPTGASSDPKAKAGLAYATARMLFEGAGKRGAIELSAAVDQLGARITTDSNADASFVSVTVLRRNFEAAFAIFGDVVARPRFESGEFKRMKDLWLNELAERRKDPDATARVVYRVVLFGADHPYGHPWDGTLESAQAIGVDDVRGLYAASWGPQRATLVCVGDVTEKELTPIARAAFDSWQPARTRGPEPVARPAIKPPTPRSAPVPAVVVPPAPKGPWPRLVLVDRADAPQAVIAAVRPGLAASDPRAPALWRVNDAIGGSFTSRLNQDLREKRGYTYGARSRFSISRGVGQVVSWANVVTDKTGDAMKAMLSDLGEFAAGGMTEDEVLRTRSQARGDLVATYQSDEGIAAHLAADASLGLPPDWAARAATLREAAGKADLDVLAKEFYDPASAVLVVVGPRAKIQPMLAEAGLPPPELRDAEGKVLK